MANLNVIISNRLEVLSEKLAHRIREPLGSSCSLPPLSAVLLPEIIIIQSRGMERWLSMEIAGYNGICANCRFPFPNHFWHELFHKIKPDLPEISPFDPDIMKFKLMNLIPAYMNTKAFADVKKYLHEDATGMMLYQISGIIADLFDQYLVFRPEMILSWEKGMDDHWQAILWRALVKENGGMHRLRIQNEIIETINNESLTPGIMPERISVFGISYLPPSYLDAFKLLSSVVQVNFYLLNPCQEYWSDIVTEFERRRIVRKYDQKTIDMDQLHLEKGNRLLSSMGIMGRDFFRKVIEIDCQIEEYFQEVKEENLLTCIQSDMLQLIDRSRSNQDAKPFPFTGDGSVQINSCHSPMREIETLHDWLLSAFEQNPDLLPKDIVVMTPDIELYAPFIDAVFGSLTDETVKIPYSIADKSIQNENKMIDGLMAILGLKDSRFGANTILSLLEYSGIKEKFELGDPELQTIRGWVEQTHIRWGINAENRMKLELPEFNENTWKAGFDRMLLGYALPGYGNHMFSGVLPYDNIEGDSAETLGKFKEFFDRIVNVSTSLDLPKSLSAWHDTLISILDQFFHTSDETERDLHAIRKAIGNLPDIENISGYGKEVEFELIHAYLKAQFNKSMFSSGFISGGVTFCAMLPMRSIPFKVVCLIGMNSDTFPRNDRQISFDLISKHPKPGDRSRRNDDKYLFLESLISARKHFYVSYVGQSIHDNSPIPPSSTVGEFIDYIRDGFGVSDDNLVQKHRRHAFHHQYFNGEKSAYFSYSEQNLLASVAMQDEPKVSVFFEKGLSEPDEGFKAVTMNDLSEFFRNPSKYLVEKRLGIYLKTEETLIADRENFNLNSLEKYSVEQEILEKRLSGIQLEQILEIQKAKGMLPHGNPGELVFSKLAAETELFRKRTQTLSNHIRLNTLDVDLEIDGFNVYGTLDTIYAPYQISMRFANARPRDFIHAWIYHLALCSFQQDQYPRKTILVCKNEAYEFDDITNSREMLGALLRLFWQGLIMPLKFFPESSFAYAENILKDADQSFSSIRKALNKWVVEFGDFKGESEDPYFKLCFSKISTDVLFDRDFCDIAQKVFFPILSLRKRVKI